MRTSLSLLIVGLCLAIPTASSQTPPPGPKVVYWPCNGVVQTAYDSLDTTVRYKLDLPGGAWNASTAAAAAAATHHTDIKCQNDCAPPIGCIKNINYTYDMVHYISGPGGESGNEFTFTIDNLKVTGYCLQC